MPGKQVKSWAKYEALRKKGYTKGSSARLANAKSGSRAKRGSKR